MWAEIGMLAVLLAGILLGTAGLWTVWVCVLAVVTCWRGNAGGKSDKPGAGLPCLGGEESYGVG